MNGWWVSVNTRLPSKPGPYLVYRLENSFTTTRLYNGEGKWSSRATITHWMPIPYAPSIGNSYDKTFGDDKLCVCGHPYYRHFDTYDCMSPAGCKYCACYTGFEESR